jgi:NAD+ diphosphatase
MADQRGAIAGPLGVLPLGRSGLDRFAELRLDEAGLAAAWSNPDTRVLVLSGGQAFVLDEPDPADPDRIRTRLVTVPAYDAPEGERYFLGGDEHGHAYFAVPAETLPGRLDGDARPASLREVGTRLDDRDAGLLTHAVALEYWHRSLKFCPRCGHATELASAGHLRRCPQCGTEHYPRTDAAVIMAVTDDADRLLLGNGASWGSNRYSVLAGFVEPGETLEQAVAREVAEEVGLTVTSVEYLGSQPWPFPSSLMLGFRAKVADPERLRVDGVEIHAARWFTREELREAVAGGEVGISGRISIARSLVENWYGGPIED